MRAKCRRIILTIIGIALIFIIIELLALAINNDIILPHSYQILYRFLQILTLSKTYISLSFTILRLITSVLLAFILAVIFGILAGVNKEFRQILRPIITLLKCMPVIIIIIILFLFISNTYSTVISTILIIFPLMYEGVVNGIDSIDDKLLDVYKLDSNIKPLVIFKVHIPLIASYNKTTITNSIGIAIKALITSEYILAVKNGIGRLIINGIHSIDYTSLYAYTLLTLIIVFLLDKLTSVIFSLCK